MLIIFKYIIADENMPIYLLNNNIIPILNCLIEIIPKHLKESKTIANEILRLVILMKMDKGLLEMTNIKLSDTMDKIYKKVSN